MKIEQQNLFTNNFNKKLSSGSIKLSEKRKEKNQDNVNIEKIKSWKGLSKVINSSKNEEQPELQQQQAEPLLKKIGSSRSSKKRRTLIQINNEDQQSLINKVEKQIKKDKVGDDRKHQD